MKPINNQISNQKLSAASTEIRAFIYQQLSDLESLLPQGSNVSIVVEDPNLLKRSKKQTAKTKKVSTAKRNAKRKPKTEIKKKVIIQLETSMGNLVVENEDVDVYKAIQGAKEDLSGQLSTLQNFLNPEDRDQQINDIIEHKYLH